MGKALNLTDEELRTMEVALCRAIYGHPHKEVPASNPRQVFGGTNILSLLEKVQEARREEPKECRGKKAARALTVMVLDPTIKTFLRENEPKALEQARKALEPFGYPDLAALRTKLGL